MVDSDNSDAMIAREIRAKMNAALIPVNQIIDSAKRQGFLVTYQTGELNGQQVVTKIDVVKKL